MFYIMTSLNRTMKQHYECGHIYVIMRYFMNELSIMLIRYLLF